MLALMRFGLGLMVWWKESQLPMVSATLCFKFASKMTNDRLFLCSDIKELLDNYIREQTQSLSLILASQFATAAVGLATQHLRHFPPSPPVQRPPSPSAIDPPRAAPEEMEERVDDTMPIRPALNNRRSLKNVSSIYDEYYGLGDYQGDPVEGGLKGLEDKYGTEWRQGDPSYQKAFSRIQQIIKIVELEMEKGRSKEEVLSELDGVCMNRKGQGLQSIWTALDSYWPQKQKRQKRVGPIGIAAPAALA